MKASHLLTTISLIGFSTGLTGCASLQGAMAKFKSGKVTTSAEMSKAVYLEPKIKTIEEPVAREPFVENLVMPGQMKANPVNVEFYNPPNRTGFNAVSYANRSAVVEPNSDNYLNAIQLYPYTPGSLYQVYTSPSQVTDLSLIHI